MQTPSSVCSYAALAALTRGLTTVLCSIEDVKVTGDGSLTGDDSTMTSSGGTSTLVMEETDGSLVA